jgi:hypothetical protein
MRLMLLMLAAALLGCAAVRTPSESTTEVSICGVLADPTAYAGREVTFRAIEVTDYFEYSSLADQRCPQTHLPIGTGPTPTGWEVSRSMHCDARVTAGEMVESRVRGTIGYHSGSIPSVTITMIETSDVRLVDGGPLRRPDAINAPGRRAWLCPNLREPPQ